MCVQLGVCLCVCVRVLVYACVFVFVYVLKHIACILKSVNNV